MAYTDEEYSSEYSFDDDSFNQPLSNSLNEEYFKQFLRSDPEYIFGKVQYLLNMFPDADPEYLQDLVMDSNGEDKKLYELMESRLLHGDYPKINKQHEKKEKQKKILTYTTNFNVEKFIQQFPEPFEYFENPYKQGQRQDSVLKLLEEHYSDQSSETIEEIYSLNQYNLTLTVNYLEVVSSNNRNTPFELKTEDLSLLQEIAFINNRNLLKEYLLIQQQQKQQQIQQQQMSDEEESFNCQCCYSEELKLREAVKCGNNHTFCKRCIIQSANVAVSQRQNFLKCLSACGSEFPLKTLKPVLPEHLYKDLEQMKQKIEISEAKIENLVSCPFCPFAMELDEKIKIFKCRNPVCMAISCRQCKKENHLPLSCTEAKRRLSTRLLEEEQLSDEVIRKCYNCDKAFIKDGGCNLMTCACGKKMCYQCRQPINSHDHFRTSSCNQWTR